MQSRSTFMLPSFVLWFRYKGWKPLRASTIYSWVYGLCMSHQVPERVSSRIGQSTTDTSKRHETSLVQLGIAFTKSAKNNWDSADHLSTCVCSINRRDNFAKGITLLEVAELN